MKKEKGTCLRSSILLLCAGMLFLANPVWTLTDIMPDLIGWLLIWAGLRELSSLNEEMASARRHALYLTAIGLLKLLGQYMLRGALYPSDSMMAATLFCGGEIACMLLFFGAFFRGTDEISRAGNCDGMYLGSGDVKFFCTLFVWTRGICTLLPELVAIPDWLVKYGNDGADFSESTFRLLRDVADSKMLFIVIASTIELIVAVIWLIRFLPFLRLFRTDKPFNDYLAAQLRHDSGEHMLRSRVGALRMAKRCVWIAILFLLDFQIDGVRILPLAGFPLFMAAACGFLNYFENSDNHRTSALLLTGSSVLLICAELYRRFFTVWDQRAYEEQAVSTEIISAVVLIVVWTVFLLVWLRFSDEVRVFSGTYAKGTLALDGIPYGLLVLYGAVEVLSYTLPIWNPFLTLPRLALMVFLWLSAASGFSAMNEETETKLALYNL